MGKLIFTFLLLMILHTSCLEVVTREYKIGNTLYDKTLNYPYFVIYPSSVDDNEYVFWKDGNSNELSINIKQVKQNFGTWFVDTDGDTKTDLMKVYKVGPGGSFTIIHTYYKWGDYGDNKDMVKSSFRKADMILKIGLCHMKRDLKIKIENDSLNLIKSK